MAYAYSCQKKSRRWPMAVFYDLLNVVGVNSMIIYQDAMKTTNIVRWEYLRKLGFVLSQPYIEERSQWKKLRRDVKSNIDKILPELSQRRRKSSKSRSRSRLRTSKGKSPSMSSQEPKKRKLEKSPKSSEHTRAEQGRCYICAREKYQKSTVKCNKCDHFVRGEHRKIVCIQCYNKSSTWRAIKFTARNFWTRLLSNSEQLNWPVYYCDE